MTNSTMTKTGSEVTFGLFTMFAAIAAKIQAAIEAEAPLGYQDQTGFHTGVKPRGEEAYCPSDL